MNRAYTRIPIGLLVLLLMFCVIDTSAVQSQIHPLLINTDSQSRLVPADINYQWTDDGLKIAGLMEKRAGWYGRIIGHVDIEMVDTEGKTVMRHSGGLTYFGQSRRNPRSAQFNTVIKHVPDNVVELRIRHAVGKWH